MKSERILDAIGIIDEKILESAERMRNGSGQNAVERRHKTAVRRRWIQIGLLVAAAGLIFAICFFAARVNRDELIPVKDPVELSGEATEVSQTESFTEEMVEDETEAVTRELIAIEEEWQLDDVGAVGFIGSRDTVLHEQFIFDIRDGVLYAKGQNGESGVDVNVCEGKLIVDGDTLFYVTWIDKQYHIMKMDVTTFQSEEILAVSPKMRKGGSWQPFSLEGKLGEYLIYRVGQCDGGINTDRLYSYHWGNRTIVELAENTDSCLIGAGEYLISFGYGLSSSMFSDVYLNVERVDGGDGMILSECSSGAVVEDGILYYLESCQTDSEVPRMEDVLVSYDLNTQKELSRIGQGTTSWKAQNNCFVSRDGMTGKEKLLLHDGTVLEYPAGFVFFRLKDRYFAATQSLIYQLNVEDGSYQKLMEINAEDSNGYGYRIFLNGENVYMDYQTLSGEPQMIVWEEELFGLDKELEADAEQNERERMIWDRQLERIRGEYDLWRVDVNGRKYAIAGAETNELYYVENEEDSSVHVISENVFDLKFFIDEKYIYYVRETENLDEIMRYDMTAGINEVLYSQPGRWQDIYLGRTRSWIELVGVTDDYLFYRYGAKDISESRESELRAVNRADGSVHVLAKNVQSTIHIGDGYVIAYEDTAEVKPVALYLCASDGSNTRQLTLECNGAVIEADEIRYLEYREEDGETYLVSYDAAADIETGRILLSKGAWCEWNGCVYEARNHKTVFTDGREISLPEDFYPVMIGDEMYVYSDDMICEIQYAQDAEGPVYGEWLRLEMPEEAEAYQYLFREQGEVVILQYLAKYGVKEAVCLRFDCG